jgi:endonuclease/exonuclease/phosphatase family metal-dependent hydrolase
MSRDTLRAMKLRVLSYNIHKGFSVGNQKFVLAKIREALRTIPLDLVFLQEVLGAHDEHAKFFEDWPMEPQFEFLADEAWPHYAYGKNAVYEAGHHGNAILSRFPILEYSNHDISTNSLERRGILHAAIEIPEQQVKVHCLNVHLNLFQRARRKQLAALGARVASIFPDSEPYILAGDFNDWSSKASHLLEKSIGAVEVFHSTCGRHAATYPSRIPFLRLDRIYVRGLVPSVARVLTGKPWSDLSDHAPIYSEIGFS